jgi:hypothetical protein
MNRHGLSLLDLLIATTLMAGLVLVLARFMNIPFKLQGSMRDAEVRRVANLALDRWVKDLKEGLPNSFTAEPSNDPPTLNFMKPMYEPAGKSLSHLPVAYQFISRPTGLGALYRVEAGSSTVILEDVEAPTPDQPLFTIDTRLRVVMISLRVRPAGRPALRFVRRVAIPR